MKRWMASLGLSAMLLVGATDVLAKPLAERPLTQESFAHIRASYAGKPLVVHLWGMTCGPCMVELPKWGQLRKSRRDMNLVLIQVDQSPTNARAETLEAAGLSSAENWYVASEFDEYLRASIDAKWIGDMPRTMLIAPNGDVTTIRGVANLQVVNQWLDSVASKR